MKQTAMFVKLMQHQKLGLIFCSAPGNTQKNCLKQAFLWHHKNALLSLPARTKPVDYSASRIPIRGSCTLFSGLYDPEFPLWQINDSAQFNRLYCHDIWHVLPKHCCDYDSDIVCWQQHTMKVLGQFQCDFNNARKRKTMQVLIYW